MTGRDVLSVNENNENFGEFYFASDPEGSSTTFTWSLSGTDGGDFNISQNGELTFRNTPDYESPADSNRNNEYLLTVVATDEGRLRGSLDVTVTVTDVDDTGPPDTDLLERYGGDDGMIDEEEVGDAIDDHFFGMGANALSQSDLEEVLDLHFFPPQS